MLSTFIIVIIIDYVHIIIYFKIFNINVCSWFEIKMEYTLMKFHVEKKEFFCSVDDYF